MVDDQSSYIADPPPPPKQSVWAAGCVLAQRTTKGTPEYLVIHRPRYRDWTLPKGKLDKGESFLEGAVREVKEETGYSSGEPRPIGSIGYETSNNNPKVVRWWLADRGKGKFRPNKEVDKLKWLSFEKARAKLTYRNDREVLDRANDMYLARSAGMIYLVRHASAGKRSEWAEGDSSRPLDKRGKRQREGIRHLLMAHPITRIGSSTYVRCVETVQPFSKMLGIPVELEPALLEGSHPHRLVALIHELQEEAAVLCTHGDVIENLIGHLQAEGIPMDGGMEWKKGSIWELRTVSGRVVSGRYIPPTH